jgi:hypothetical protein
MVRVGISEFTFFQVIMMFPLVCFSFILMQYAGGEVITLQKGKEVYCATKYRAFK